MTPPILPFSKRSWHIAARAPSTIKVTVLIMYGAFLLGGGRGEGCLTNTVYGNDRGEGFYVPFCFCKKENLERLKEYILYLDFYK